MECRDVVEAVVDRLAGELPARRATELDEHLGACPACRNEARAAEEAWGRLGEDADAVVSSDFARDTCSLLSDATLARRVRQFPAARPRYLSQVAAVLLAGFVGYSLARGTGQRADVSALGEARYPVLSQKTLDVSETRPDLTQRPRLANVSYRPADASGRIAVAFDVTTRYTLIGRPEDKGLAEVLAYLVASGNETEGGRGRAIDVVSQSYRQATPPSPQVVAVLAETLRSDRNPGVRRKAAEALAQLPATPAIRDAFMAALKGDSNPAVRMLAVEGLAKVATELGDSATIETLREKAGDASENGYVRGQAALALRRMKL